MEGEGHFYKTNRGITVSQMNSEPIGKLKSLFGGFVALDQFKYKGEVRHIFRWTISGEASIAVVKMLYPLLSEKRKAECAYSFRPIFDEG